MDVRLPDGTIVTNVPDGITQAELMRRVNPQKRPSTVADVATQAAFAPAKGLTGALGTALDLFRGAGGFVAEKMGGAMGVDPANIRAAAQASPATVRMEYPQAETEPGKRIGGVLQAGSEGLFFGGLPGLVPGLLGGAGAEGAGMLTNDNPLARAAGGLLTPIGVGAAQAYKNAPAQMVREAIGDQLSPQQIAQAKAMQEEARRLGINLSAPEVLPDSGIQQLASNVLASRGGNKQMTEFLAQRPGQVKSAVESRLINQIATQGTPDANMRAARNAATDVIDAAEKARTAKSSPFYQRAQQEGISQDSIRAVINRIDDEISKTSDSRVIRELTAYKNNLIKEVQTIEAPSGRIVSESGELFNKGAPATRQIVPEDRMSSLIRTEQLNRYGNQLPAVGAQSEDVVRSMITKPFDIELAEALKRESPNFRQGAKVHSDFTRDVIDPLTSGPVGRVAGRQGVDPSLPESLSPLSAIANQQIARPDSIKELYKALNKENPKAFQGMARTYLENAFDTASKRVQGGENRMMGANFANTVMGTPQQEANLKEIMRGVAEAQGRKPDEVVKGVEKLFETLRATGKIPGVGSQTAPRLSGDQLARNSVTANVMDVASARPLGAFADKIRDWTMRGSYKKLADAMTSPDGVEKLAKMGKYNPSTTTFQYFMGGLLNLSESDQ